MGKTTSAAAPTSPEISSAEGKVDLLKRKLDQAKQQLDAAKAHLRAAEAEYKAAIADKEALILRTKARELATAAAVEPVDKVEAAPAQTNMLPGEGAPVPTSLPQPATLQDLH
jgi:malonyl CoA-acyl carrier protein transacylase